MSKRHIRLTKRTFDRVVDKLPEHLRDVLRGNSKLDGDTVTISKKALHNGELPAAVINELTASGDPSRPEDQPRMEQAVAQAPKETSAGIESNEIKWRGVGAAVVGRNHLLREPAMPCQDAFTFQEGKRPLAVLCDGAGSAQQSHVGARIISGLSRAYLIGNESRLAYLLDGDAVADEAEWAAFAGEFTGFLKGAMVATAEALVCRTDDLRCTIALTVFGSRRMWWYAVGDSPIVVADSDRLSLATKMSKGEFVNQTTFVSPSLGAEAVSSGWRPIDQVTGVAMMSDGAAERLVSTNGIDTAPRLAEFVQGVSSGALSKKILLDFLLDGAVWRKTSGDDRTVVLLSRVNGHGDVADRPLESAALVDSVC